MALPAICNHPKFTTPENEVITTQSTRANNSLTKSLVQNITTHCGMGYIVSGFNPVGAAAGLIIGTLSTITGVGVSTLMNKALPEQKGTFVAKLAVETTCTLISGGVNGYLNASKSVAQYNTVQ